MTILHVTDFHFNKRWFDWLLHRAPAHDLVVMSGDLLDLSSATPLQRQIEWASEWLNDFPRLLSVSSGHHDLEWNATAQRWTPAYWLRRLTNPRVWTDNQRVQLNGFSILNLSATTRPRGGEADAWVVHTPPGGTLVSTHRSGADAGDPELASAVRRFSPRVVFSGDLHSPLHWCEQRGSTLFLNPGKNAGGAFPNHILVRTGTMSCEFISEVREESRDVRMPDSGTPRVEQTSATVAIA